MSRRKSQKVSLPSSDPESSDDEPISQSVDRRRKQAAQGPAEEDDSQGEEDSEGEVPLTKRKAAKPSAGKARGKAAERKERAGPSKKSKRAPASKRSAPSGEGAEDGDCIDSDCDDDNTRLEEAAKHYEMEATDAQDGDINPAEEMRLVRNVMRHMLFNQQKKNAVPVKRQELTNIILKNNKGGKAAKHLGNRIIRQAAWQFVKLFGIEMKEIETKRSTIHGEQETGVKVYVLRSLLPVNLRNFSKSVPTQLNQSLAMVIMSIITLAGGKMSEDDLEFQVAKIGIDLKSHHPTLGKPADQMQTLVQKRYLAEKRANGPDGPCKEYAVGDAFIDEVQVDKLSGFIEKIFSHAPMTQPV